MYSPFDKPISDLQPADLACLTSVSEGWYIEYKSALLPSKALAKSLSAFANTYGGWLFIGVKEQGKADPVAGSFPGVLAEDLNTAVSRLRHAASEHLNPAPYFQTKLLLGPCLDVGLAAGVAVAAIRVPQGHVGPHVHRDGRIYRRVADGSEPKPETDRFVLDQLWERREFVRGLTREWVGRDPEFSKGEEDVPYVRVLMCVDPWRQRNRRLQAPASEIRTIVTDARVTASPSVPFDTFYGAGEGFVGRQVKTNDPHSYGLTWRIWRDLACELVLPLPLYGTEGVAALASALVGYEHGRRLVEICRAAGYAQPRVADLNFLASVLMGVTAKYRRLLKLGGVEGMFYYKVRVLNSWRVLPFIDVAETVEEYEKHGLPIAIDGEVTYPDGDGPDSFLRVAAREGEGSGSTEEVCSQIQALVVFAGISRALGVPILREDGAGVEAGFVGLQELVRVGARAMEVQRRRGGRGT